MSRHGCRCCPVFVSTGRSILRRRCNDFGSKRAPISPPPKARISITDVMASSWQGSSSTYAIPKPGRPREMIPYLLVDEAKGDPRGWYAGIEFSGRTRMTLKRAGGHRCNGEAGLDPDPGPYRTRVPPGGSLRNPKRFLSAHFAAARMRRPIFFAAGYERCSTIRIRWPIRPIPCWSTTAGAAAWPWTKPWRIE